MIKRYRKEAKSELSALQYSEETANLVARMTNRDDFIPKRKQKVIGDRLVNHAIETYEYIRFANSIKPTTLKEESIRLSNELNACKSSMNLCSDIKLLPNIIGIPIGDKRIEMLTISAVKSNNIITAWYNADMERYEKHKEEDRDERAKRIKEEKNRDLKLKYDRENKLKETAENIRKHNNSLDSHDGKIISINDTKEKIMNM